MLFRQHDKATRSDITRLFFDAFLNYFLDGTIYHGLYAVAEMLLEILLEAVAHKFLHLLNALILCDKLLRQLCADDAKLSMHRRSKPKSFIDIKRTNKPGVPPSMLGQADRLFQSGHRAPRTCGRAWRVSASLSREARRRPGFHLTQEATT